jgi:hypothetical protein
MYTEITEWYKQGALKAVDYKENRLDDYLEAINNQEGSKQVFIP